MRCQWRHVHALQLLVSLLHTVCLSLTCGLIPSASSLDAPLQVGVKTLTGRKVDRDPLQSAEGWSSFSAGFLVGGLSGCAWGYICTQRECYRGGVGIEMAGQVSGSAHLRLPDVSVLPFPPDLQSCRTSAFGSIHPAL